MLSKRFLQVGSLLLMVLLLFTMTACGSGGKSEQTPPDKEQTEPKSDAAAEPIELNFLHVFTGPRGEAMEKIVQGFNNSQDGIVVKHEHVPGWYGGLLEKLQALAVAKQLPDITIMGLDSHNFMVDALGAVSVDQYIKAENYDLGDYFPNMLSLGLDKNGNQHALPFAISTPLLYVNQDLLDKAGLTFVEQPESWTDIREWGKTIAAKTDADGVALQVDFDTWQFQMFLESFGGKMADLDKKETMFDGEAGQRVMDFWLGMMHKDKIWPNITGSEAAENFINGDLGILLATTGNLAEFSKNAKFKLGVMLLPKYDDMVHRNPRVIPAGGSNIYIMPTTDAKQKAAWEFLKYATSPEVGATVVEGMGYMAPRKSLQEKDGLLADYVAKNPLATKSYEQVDSLSDWFNWPGLNGARITNEFLTQFGEAFLQQKTGQQMLTDIAGEVKTILGW